MRYLKHVCVLIYLSLCINFVYAQNDTTATITILAGGSVNFHFNSYKKINDGITVPYSNGWTRLRTQYKVTDDMGNTIPTNWTLSVRSATNQIVNDGTGTGLDLATVRIRAEGTDVNTTGWTQISSTDQVIADGSVSNATVITISYECGVSPQCTSVQGENPGFYFADLIFTLTKRP